MLAFLIAASVMANPVTAKLGPERSAKATSCSGADTPSANACLGARFQQSNAILNRYYQAALKRAARDGGRSTAQRLIKAEQSWMTYRDMECGAVFNSWGGTIRASMEVECRIRLTRLRTYALWRDWLTYVDSTPPILRRPDIDSLIKER